MTEPSKALMTRCQAMRHNIFEEIQTILCEDRLIKDELSPRIDLILTTLCDALAREIVRISLVSDDPPTVLAEGSKLAHTVLDREIADYSLKALINGIGRR